MRQGRTLEILVAQLEHIFGAGSLTVRSPEFIPNRHTGDLVEVDVTLRGRLGSTEVLIALECRDRGKPQGINWIRELATKRDDIGADSIVAVSRKGFTKDARAEAAIRRVQLRSFSSLAPQEVAEGLLGVQLAAHRPRFSVTGIRKVIYRGFTADWPPFPPGMPQLTMDRLLDMANSPTEKPVFDEKERKEASFLDMVRAADWKTPYVSLAVGTSRTVDVELPCRFTDAYGRQDAERFRWFFDAMSGVVFTELVVIAKLWYEPEPVQLSSVFEYSKENKRVARVAEFDISPYGWPEERLQVFMLNEAPSALP